MKRFAAVFFFALAAVVLTVPAEANTCYQCVAYVRNGVMTPLTCEFGYSKGMKECSIVSCGENCYQCEGHSTTCPGEARMCEPWEPNCQYAYLQQHSPKWEIASVVVRTAGTEVQLAARE